MVILSIYDLLGEESSVDEVTAKLADVGFRYYFDGKFCPLCVTNLQLLAREHDYDLGECAYLDQWTSSNENRIVRMFFKTSEAATLGRMLWPEGNSNG